MLCNTGKGLCLQYSSVWCTPMDFKTLISLFSLPSLFSMHRQIMLHTICTWKNKPSITSLSENALFRTLCHSPNKWKRQYQARLTTTYWCSPPFTLWVSIRYPQTPRLAPASVFYAPQTRINCKSIEQSSTDQWTN